MKKKILVIDDDPDILSVIDFILTEAGYAVLTAGDGYRGMESIRSDQGIELVLLDLRMPKYSGLEVLCDIKKINSSLFVLIMTGYEIDDKIKSGFELGAYGVIYKPFHVNEFVAVVERAMKMTSVCRK